MNTPWLDALLKACEQLQFVDLDIREHVLVKAKQEVCSMKMRLEQQAIPPASADKAQEKPRECGQDLERKVMDALYDAQWCEKCGGMWGNHSTEQHDALSGAVEQEKPREWPCEHVLNVDGRWCRIINRGTDAAINQDVLQITMFCPICGAVRPSTPADSGKEGAK